MRDVEVVIDRTPIGEYFEIEGALELIRSIATERDKFEREIERLRDKVDQEKTQLISERQILRDQVLKLENGLKLVEE